MTGTYRQAGYSTRRAAWRAVAAGLGLALLLGACGGGGAGTGDISATPAGGPSSLDTHDSVSGGVPAPGGTASTGHTPVTATTDVTLY